MESSTAHIARVEVRRLLTPQLEARRQEAEQFIAERFRATHGARVRHFMPVLLGARHCDGRLVMVCGMRTAEHADAMFLEHYLQQPAETALSSILGTRIARARLAEIGNLAVAAPATARELIFALTHHLATTSIDWVVFTGVAALRNAFRRLCIPVLDLGDARLHALPQHERNDWGTYYDSRPRVCAVSVHAALLATGGYRAEAA